MHKILPFLFTCILSSVLAQHAANHFQFTGTVNGVKQGYLFLNYIDSSGYFKKDSSKIISGKFLFSGYINSPHMSSIETSVFATENTRKFFLETGKQSAVFNKQNFKRNAIAGSKSQEEYLSYQQLAEQVQEDKREQITKQFVYQHPASFVSAYLLQNEIFNLPYDTLKAYFSQLSTAVQNGVEGSIVKEYISKHEAVTVGQQAPDFMQPDSSGAPVWLHDFKGQYVLLDFWASWCAPCRAEAPHLKQVYSRFKNKGFTIISVSIDEEKNRAAWLNAIQKDSLYWPQLCNFTAWGNKVAKTYNALSDGIPSNFLINPQGTIIAAQLHGEALEEKLTEVLGSN